MANCSLLTCEVVAYRLKHHIFKVSFKVWALQWLKKMCHLQSDWVWIGSLNDVKKSLLGSLGKRCWLRWDWKDLVGEEEDSCCRINLNKTHSNRLWLFKTGKFVLLVLLTSRLSLDVQSWNQEDNIRQFGLDTKQGVFSYYFTWVYVLPSRVRCMKPLIWWYVSNCCAML